jgi:hypothetical protein
MCGVKPRSAECSICRGFTGPHGANIECFISPRGASGESKASPGAVPSPHANQDAGHFGRTLPAGLVGLVALHFACAALACECDRFATLRTGQAAGASDDVEIDAGGARIAFVALFAARAGIAAIALRSGRTYGARNAGVTFVTLVALRSSRTGRASGASRSSRPCGAAKPITAAERQRHPKRRHCE